MNALLDHLVRDILGKLEMLADGSTANLDPDKVIQGSAESSIPKGAADSLYEFYRREFERNADNPRELRVLWMLAHDDYEDFRFKADHRIELRKGELLDNDPRDGGKAEEAQAKRVVDWYEGRPARYVAVLEKQTEAWVRKARSQLGRNPEDGTPKPEFLDLDEEDRRRKVAYLAAHMGKKRAAQKLGVDPQTIRKYWPKSAETEPQPLAA